MPLAPIFVVSREDIMSKNTAPLLNSLNTVLIDADTMRSYKAKVSISFHGYDHTSIELWEMLEVRDFVRAIDNEFPYWLYFMSKENSSFLAILRCFLPPNLTPAAEAKIYPAETESLFNKRWIPALEHLGSFLDLPSVEIQTLIDHSWSYFFPS